MYKIEKKENYEIYAFDEIDLRIKIVDNTRDYDPCQKCIY